MPGLYDPTQVIFTLHTYNTYYRYICVFFFLLYKNKNKHFYISSQLKVMAKAACRKECVIQLQKSAIQSSPIAYLDVSIISAFDRLIEILQGIPCPASSASPIVEMFCSVDWFFLFVFFLFVLQKETIIRSSLSNRKSCM